LDREDVIVVTSEAMHSIGIVVLVLIQHTTSAPVVSNTDDNTIAGSDDKVSVDDIFISVKTSGKFHKSRLSPILDTWFSLALSSTWIFSDEEDPDVTRRTGGHLIKTACPSDHGRASLCCKMEAELTTFLTGSDRSWFCHLDDDNYLNVPALVKMLSSYSWKEEWYLGKASISSPLEMLDRSMLPEERKVSFLFGTGGAGFCLSRPLVSRMVVESIAATGEAIRLPDDVTVGYIAEILMGVPLTQIGTLHSHLEPLRRITRDILEDQVTLSYSTYEDGQKNVVGLEGMDLDKDLTTFYAIHCQLFPASCNKL
jgi:fringe protein